VFLQLDEWFTGAENTGFIRERSLRVVCREEISIRLSKRLLGRGGAKPKSVSIAQLQESSFTILEVDVVGSRC
jgi:hypothetical protein